MKYQLIYLFLFISINVYSQKDNTAEITSLKSQISYLSSDKLKGRLVGSKSEQKAAVYIQDVFKSINLKPLLGEDFYQNFDFLYNSNPHDTLASNKLNIKSRNVVAFLDNNATTTIVIGAHYDHLGKNEYNQSTKPNSKGEIHNGADDNSSGVAGVLLLAQKLSTNNITEKTNFIFACFSGEEVGLMGSKALVLKLDQHPSKIVAMLNLDMIGRMDSTNKIQIGGVGTSRIFNDLLTLHKPKDFNTIIDSSGIGPSDHTPFYLDSIPVLFFSTGTHEDYHKPSDKVEKINFEDLYGIINYVYDVAIALSNEENIDFIKTKDKPKKRSSQLKVSLGIMPSYTDFDDGLHVDGVMNGRVADKAGIKKGDIIIKINDCEIKEIYSYMKCLSKIGKGENATITIIREDKTIPLKITFK